MVKALRRGLMRLLFLTASNVMAQSPEGINPDDTITVVSMSSTESNFVTAVTDADDATYVFADAAAQVCRYSFANTSGVPSDATADSIIVKWRSQDNGNGSNRQRIRLRMDGNTNFCDGANISVTTSWVDYEDRFTAAPTTAGTCTNAWGTGSAKFDSVNVQLTCTALGGSREVRIAKLAIDVYYTEASGATGRRRRIQLIGKFDIDEQREFATGELSFGISLRGTSWIWSNG